MFHYVTCLIAILFIHNSFGEFFRAPGNGPCRGIGGVSDKVNSRYAYEIDEDFCRQECASLENCNGYAHSPSENEGECILYGPRLDGECFDPVHLNKLDCLDNIGTCVPGDTNIQIQSKALCGSCSDKSASSIIECAKIDGASWSEYDWIPDSSAWEGPPDPWVGDSQHSTIVVGTTDEISSSLVCWEIDAEDHYATCTGDEQTCVTPFMQLDGLDRTITNCPEECEFKEGPTTPPPPEPHPGDIRAPGWPAPLSGACRGGVNGTSRVNSIYASIHSQTQHECMSKCVSLSPNCTGYHHGPYCSVFGPGVELAADDETWFANTADETLITGTKANDQYICFTSVPTYEAASSAEYYSHSFKVLLGVGFFYNILVWF